VECIVLEASDVLQALRHYHPLPALLASVLSVCAPLTARASGSEPATSTVGIVLHFDQPYSDNVLRSMEDEAEGILRRAHLRLAWHFFEDALGSHFDYQIAVVRLHGSCRVPDVEQDQDLEGPLGITHFSEGIPLLQGDLYCDRLGDLVGPEIRSLGPTQSEFLLGRALGRVLAHELYHMLGQTRHHGKDGVTKPVFTARELVTGGLRLERAESDRIVDRLAAPHGEPEDLDREK
jgi:hypothetical protein